MNHNRIHNITELGPDHAMEVFDWVLRLLVELGEEGDDVGTLAAERLKQLWTAAPDKMLVLAARTAAGEIAGLVTVVEAFAIYANGHYGIINEMYVAPEERSSGVGAGLVDAVKRLGASRGWSRIDVTAPESQRWARTRRFYEQQGFTFTGPKLKLMLSSQN